MEKGDLTYRIITIEIKAKSLLAKEDFSQALNTLEQLNIKNGLLFNFGSTVLEYKHLFNNAYEPNKESIDITPEMVGEPSNELWELRNYLPDWVIHKMQHDKKKKG